MKTIEKQTFWVLLVVILITINGGLIAFMWYTQHPGQDEGPGTTKFLSSQLNFNPDQLQQYIKLQHQLNDSIEPVKEEERKIHDRFFAMMNTDAPDTMQVAAIIDTMGHIRSKIEYFTFQHFRQVRALCNAEQKKKFDVIIADAMRRMGPRPSRKNGGITNGPDGPPPGQGPPPR